MKKINFQILFLFISLLNLGQKIALTDHIYKPRLDSTYWEKDHDALNKVYSRTANKCQTCVFLQTDTTPGRFCFNTSLGHVQMDSTLHNFAIEKLIGHW
ncbi:MAG: hypothetical protein JNJ40_08955 [Bacteroidia bacterium]|nr:hypothetical protein [Bacteroidia bacterium]